MVVHHDPMHELEADICHATRINLELISFIFHFDDIPIFEYSVFVFDFVYAIILFFVRLIHFWNRFDANGVFWTWGVTCDRSIQIVMHFRFSIQYLKMQIRCRRHVVREHFNLFSFVFEFRGNGFLYPIRIFEWLFLLHFIFAVRDELWVDREKEKKKQRNKEKHFDKINPKANKN